MRKRYLSLIVTVLATLHGGPVDAESMEKVRVATTFVGLWDTSQPTFCKDRGEFTKAGLDVDVLWTRGGSENVQAVVTGAADIGASGTNAVIGAYGGGARIKIIAAQFMGQNDTFFYVPADSPIKSIGDLAGKTVAFPRPGGAGEAILLALKAERKIDFKPVSTGAMDATFTMTMTKQVDVGYSVPPSGLAAVDSGQVRIVFAGDDVESLRNITGRVMFASNAFLEKKREVARKFLEVLDRCIDWAYANKAESAKMYANLNKIDPKIAEKGLAFYKRETLAFGPIKGLDSVLQQAIDGKFIDKPLTQDQAKNMIDIVYTPK